MVFAPGVSGNPGGRPKTDPEVKRLAKTYTADAIERLAHWMRSSDPNASVSAARELLARGWGKPEQPIEATGDLREFLIQVPIAVIAADSWEKTFQPTIEIPHLPTEKNGSE